MPNWCEADFVVEGPREDVEKFREYAKTEDTESNVNVLDTNKFIPYPEKFTKMDEASAEHIKKHGWKDAPKDGFNSGGYEWCWQNWGTKWGICNAEIVNEEAFKEEFCIEYSFETAWSPCIPVIKKMAEMFPTLNFTYKYFECGCAFNGILVIEKGKVVNEEEGVYFGSRGG